MRRLIWLLMLAASVFACQSDGIVTEEAPIEVLEISGPLDDAVMGFIIESIEQAGGRSRQLVVVQLNSPGVVGSEARFERLAALLADPPVPVAVWVGPAPAVAYGGSAQLLSVAPLSFAATGTEVGYSLPTIAGGSAGSLVPGALDLDSAIRVEAPIAGLVDDIHPVLSNLLQALDGRAVDVGGTVHTLSTLQPADEGVTSRPTIFRQPDLGIRTLRLAVNPEAAFFFLMAGLSVAVFEFYAIGPGIAAAVAGLSLLLAGYGLVVLPLRPWAVGLAGLGWLLLTWSYQRGTVVWLTTVGAITAAIGGLFFTDAAPQIAPHPIGVMASVLAVLFFYLLALPTVARARFSTPHIGREGLIGKEGRAGTDFSPDGVAVVDGARWRATAHREAKLREGDRLRVVVVNGLFLEVVPSPSEREN